MQKDAAITVRIPATLKRRLEASARRERRSLSAQIATYLEQGVEADTAPGTGGKLLGLFEGTTIPTEKDFAKARRLSWDRLRVPEAKRGA